MDCQECHERTATLHFTKVVNGNKTEIHVCEHCAKEKGYVSYDEEAYSLHDLLSGLFNFSSPSVKQNSFVHTQGKTCEKCGMSYSDFTRIGKFGCAECYHTFEDHLNPIFRRVHSGNTTHHGKIPKRIGVDINLKKTLTGYKEKLQQLIEGEEFEEAAKVRDKIKSLEKDLSRNGGDD
ncbi:UvrB/UvrC motif-containing protein [Aquibacillus salsiterrae]|uniref:UvrB/UvrC motif-containing protein n=1 Tax=Aquibacillus salsiterrae TaxID=2950439 RepID=A0A9X3WG69_9BACI|nr:UvrB/UvrC motif-containing protein [Aquibacillus salsiterrae]MDC3417765.1 UvrB/UvrC motif-containing protein [Aquibacillus salsiterrae]